MSKTEHTCGNFQANITNEGLIVGDNEYIYYSRQTGLKYVIKNKINQGYISRLERKGIRKIKDIVLNQAQYKKKYRFEINKNEYIFSVLKEQISEDRLKEIISKNHSLKFELTNEWIYIHLKASSKSFIKISQLIQEIDDIKL